MQSAPDWRGLADDLEEREPEKSREADRSDLAAANA